MDVRLVMFKESGERKEFPLGEGMTLIGRQEDCDLRIPLGEISRRHAQIIIHEGTVTLRDLGSSNGTYVNNQRITEQELNPGDHVVLGPVVFTVQIDGEPAELRHVRTRLEARAQEPSMKVPPPNALEGTDITTLDDADLFAPGGGEVDPISALEQLAASGEQASLDDILGDDEPKP